MLYLAVFVLGASVGAWFSRWWDNWLDSADDVSIRRHSRASQAINPRRWD